MKASGMPTRTGFRQIDISPVAREKQAPHFQTILAIATKE